MVFYYKENLKFPTEADVLNDFNFPCHLAALQIHGLGNTYTKFQKIQEAASENQAGRLVNPYVSLKDQ